MIVALIVCVIILDQFTKWLVCKTLIFGEVIPVIANFFNIRKVYNDGAAWGIMSGMRPILVAVSFVMLGLIWWNREEILNSGKISRISVGLLVGGIVGNLLDRMKLGYVVDFLDFYWKSYTYPTFNVADSAICIGVFLFAISQFLAKEKS